MLLSGLLAVHRETVRTLENLEVVAQGAEMFEVDQYNEGIVALGTLRESYRRVRDETFAPGELPGLADDGWQRFVTSAAEYLEHLGLVHYPEDGHKCIYCRQLLDPGALSIVQRYATFLDDALGRQISDQQRVVAATAATLTALSVDGVATGLSRWREVEPHIKRVRGCRGAYLDTCVIQSDKSGMENGSHAATYASSLEESGRESSQLFAAHESEVATLTKQLADRETALQVAETALRTLTAAIELDRRSSEIRVFVENAKRATRLDGVLKRLTAALALSSLNRSKLASEDLVNSDFQGRFQEECKALRTPTVRLEFIGREGKGPTPEVAYS